MNYYYRTRSSAVLLGNRTVREVPRLQDRAASVEHRGGHPQRFSNYHQRFTTYAVASRPKRVIVRAAGRLSTVQSANRVRIVPVHTTSSVSIFPIGSSVPGRHHAPPTWYHPVKRLRPSMHDVRAASTDRSDEGMRSCNNTMARSRRGAMARTPPNATCTLKLQLLPCHFLRFLLSPPEHP